MSVNRALRIGKVMSRTWGRLALALALAGLCPAWACDRGEAFALQRERVRPSDASCALEEGAELKLGASNCYQRFLSNSVIMGSSTPLAMNAKLIENLLSEN